MSKGFIKTLYYSSVWCKLLVVSTIIISIFCFSTDIKSFIVLLASPYMISTRASSLKSD